MAHFWGMGCASIPPRQNFEKTVQAVLFVENEKPIFGHLGSKVIVKVGFQNNFSRQYVYGYTDMFYKTRF